MLMKLTWETPKHRSLIFILLGFATSIQFIIVLLASHYFLINSAYLFTFLSIGIIILLTGVEMLSAQLIHSFRIHRRQSKRPKKRKKLKKVSEVWSIFIGAGIAIGLFCLIYFTVAYFIMDPLKFLLIPFFGKFTLVEILTGIILIILILILDAVIPQK